MECVFDRWYEVKVELDYTLLLMDVWIDGQKVIEDLAARPREDSNIFFVATTRSGSVQGTTPAYFDDVAIY